MSTSAGPPVSVKAALRSGASWVLLRNDRGEWELPGGRIDGGDASLRDALIRECREELGIAVQVGELIDTYLFEVLPGRRVTIICFAATAAADTDMHLSDEHVEVGLFDDDELDGLALPSGYRQMLSRASALLPR